MAISWNQAGPVGPTGATGPQGPAGAAGTLASLDSLEGLGCKGVNGKPASVHLDYGTGIEAAAVDAPRLTDCSGSLAALGDYAGQVLDFFAGSGTMQFTGTLDPIILAP